MQRLAALLASRQASLSVPPVAAAVVATGWHVIDRALAPVVPGDVNGDVLAHVGRGGLRRGVIHEWMCGGSPTDDARVHRWLAPHGLFIHLAWRAIESADSDAGGLVIWIGRRVWPVANAMCRSCDAHPSIQDSLLPRSLFIDPPDDASRLWTIDLSLRSSAASAVVADGSGLKMAESRRLQLAAERSRALALLARPARERSELSAAATRWRVRRAVSPSARPRWVITLVRCRPGETGLQQPHGRAWEMEYASTGHVRLVADVVDRPGSTRQEEGGGRRRVLA